MSRFLRASLGDGFGYLPGEQPPDHAGWTKLNTNESPFPPSPRVAPAVAAAATQLHRYPSPHAEPLRSELAAFHGVAPEQVVAGNGADGLIEACFAAFCEPGSTVVLTEPTYSLLAVAARLRAVRVESFAVGPDGDLPAAFAAAPAPLRFVVNPNSPTGTWLPPERLAEQLAGAPGVVVVDEAYCDFAPASCIPLLDGQPSWIVLRTFSKSYSLAGLRVGYAVASAELIADLQAVGESYPVDRCAIAGASAALADREHHASLVAAVRAERARLSDCLAELGWRLTDSQANFVCGRPPGGDAEAVAERLREHRILVRRFGAGEEAVLRITVGSREENDALLARLG